MEEMKQEFIPLPDIDADVTGEEIVRSENAPADPLPSRMTREYSEFLHRFDDADPEGPHSRNGASMSGTDSLSAGPEEGADAGLPVEVIAGSDELEAAMEYTGSDPYFAIDFQEKQYGSAVDDNNPAEEIVDSGSFSLPDAGPTE